MARYIGLDVHARSCTMVVLGPSGKKLNTHVLETNGQALVEAIKLIPQPRLLCMEEGTQCAWVYEILKPHVDDLMVINVGESRGQKGDELDAYNMAEGLRIGKFKKRVYKEESGYGRLRERGRVYSKMVEDDVRAHNRVRAIFRSRAVDTQGGSLYRREDREQWLKKLPEKMRSGTQVLLQQCDALGELRDTIEKELLQESKKHKVSRLLQTCPGIGPIRGALLQAIVVVPERFRSKRQFWAYSGLGIVTRSSSDWKKGESGKWVRSSAPTCRGLNRNFNRALKHIFKGAATTIITQLPGEELHKDYQRMLEGGTKPDLAKLTLARKVSAIVLSMWKNKQEYDPNKTGEPNP